MVEGSNLVWLSPRNSVAQMRAAAIDTHRAPSAVVAVAAIGFDGICRAAKVDS